MANNSRNNVSITGTDAADVVNNTGSNATITSGAGDDSIYNYAYNASIDAGADKDYVYNSGRYAKINGNAGDDKIYNSYSGDYSTINGGDGNDSIYSSDEDNSSIDGGDGNDTLMGNYYSSTINGGAGDDVLVGYYYNSSISGGADNDKIDLSNGGYYNTVNGGTGEDTIYADTINGSPALIEYNAGDGDDVLYGFRSNSTLRINGTVDSIGSSGSEAGSDLYLAVGQNVITLKNAVSARFIKVITNDGDISASLEPYASKFELYSGTPGNDYIELNDSNNVGMKVVTDGGDDTVTAYSNYSHDKYLDTGDGNDYIGNNGYSSTIDAGAGNDEIYACYNTRYDSIEGGEGNDYIQSGGPYSTINGGAGNDTIYSYGENSTIYGGIDNDFIINEATSAKLDGGDGNDYIYNYYYSDGTTINGGAGDDDIYNEAVNVSINGGEGNNLIALDGDNSTVRVADGNDSIMLGYDVSTLKVEGFNAGDRIVLADVIDEIEHSGSNVIAGNVTIGGINETITATSWSFEDNVASYVQTDNNSAVLLNDGRTIVYGQGRTSKSEVLATVSGITSTDGLSIDVENKVITVSISSLSQDLTVTVSDGYRLALDKDVPKPTEYDSAGWRFNENEKIATYKTDSTTDGYVLENNEISYQSEGEGETLVTVKGVTSIDGLKLEGNVVTVSETALSKDSEVTISDGYTLALGEVTPIEKIETKGWRLDDKTASYVNGSTTKGYVLENNKIYYKSEGMENTLVTVNGVVSTEGLTIDTEGKVVKVKESSLSKDLTVTVNNGYTLELDGVTEMTPKEIEWSYTGSNAEGRIEVAKGGSGYRIENNTIRYVTEGTTIASVIVYGVNTGKQDVGIEVDPVNKVVTLSKTALTGVSGPVRVSNGYTLKLDTTSDDRVSEPIFTDATRSRVDSKLTYTDAGRTAGWKIENNKAVFYSAVNSANIEIKGVYSEDGVERDMADEDTFIVHSSALNKEKVTIDEGYYLALGSDVKTQTRDVKRGWQLDGTTAAYHTGSKTEVFRLRHPGLYPHHDPARGHRPGPAQRHFHPDIQGVLRADPRIPGRSRPGGRGQRKAHLLHHRRSPGPARHADHLPVFLRVVLE